MEGGGRGIVSGVTRLGEIEAMRERVEGELGPIDLLVANAGATRRLWQGAGWHASASLDFLT